MGSHHQQGRNPRSKQGENRKCQAGDAMTLFDFIAALVALAGAGVPVLRRAERNLEAKHGRHHPAE